MNPPVMHALGIGWFEPGDALPTRCGRRAQRAEVQVDYETADGVTCPACLEDLARVVERVMHGLHP